jgi:hypothetical protein
MADNGRLNVEIRVASNMSQVASPRVSPFHHPSKLAEPTAVSGPALRDHGLDAEVAKRLSMRLGIKAAIGVDDLGLPQWPPARAANRWNRVDTRQQRGDVVAVGARQDHANWSAVGIYEDVVFRTGSRTIHGVRTSFRPPQQLAPTTSPQQRGKNQLVGLAQVRE